MADRLYPAEEFFPIVRRRQFMINITIAAYVFLFIGAFVALIVGWNARNLRISNVNKFQQAKNKVLFGAIFTAIAAVMGLFALIGRMAARGYTNWLPISAMLFLFTAVSAALSFCLFTVYFSVGRKDRQTQDKYLKAIVGMATILIASILFVLLFSVGLSNEAKQLLIQ